MLDWLSRKLLGAVARAGQLPLDRESRDYLPPGALPASCLVARTHVRRPLADRGRRGGERPRADTELPARSAKIIPLSSAVGGGLDRPPARRPASAASRKTNP